MDEMGLACVGVKSWGYPIVRRDVAAEKHVEKRTAAHRGGCFLVTVGLNLFWGGGSWSEGLGLGGGWGLEG